MKSKQVLVSMLILGLLLTLGAGLSQAQGSQPAAGEERPMDVATITPGAIPIQGRLTDSSGNPLADGSYSVTFRLYESGTGGSPICSDNNTVTVTDGLFSSYMDYCYDDLYGQKVWLAVKVGADGEMTPRRPIYAVPYALSLRPGAHIAGPVTASPYAALQVWNTASSGSAYGIKGGTDSPLGRAVYGDALNGGTGVYAKSDTGVAFKAAGTGVIQSSAKSYIWISGNNLRKKRSSDSTQFELDIYGGVKVTPGGTGKRDVMLPVTLPGQLYGQNVTLTGIDVYFKSQGDFDGIDGTYVRRQTGAGSGATIIANTTDRVCTTACSYHLNLTTNNVLSDEHGVVYIAFQLFFGGSSNYVQIGGVRLTLEHD